MLARPEQHQLLLWLQDFSGQASCLVDLLHRQNQSVGNKLVKNHCSLVPMADGLGNGYSGSMGN